MASSLLFEFHISANARQKYKVSNSLFALQGRVMFANFHESRALARQLTEHGLAVPAAELNAFGLMDEVLHMMIQTYVERQSPNLFTKIEDILSKEDTTAYREILSDFCRTFPPVALIDKPEIVPTYLESALNRRVVLEEMILLWLENRNPAFQTISELIGSDQLKHPEAFNRLLSRMEAILKEEPAFADSGKSLLDWLQIPAKTFPDAIMAQFEYILKHWKPYLGDMLSRLLISMDFIREEQMARFDPAVFGPGPTRVIDFSGNDDFEPEQFSVDLDWMPRLVLIAKSTYVWLDQLSKTYKTEIRRLDQIPDAELDQLAGRGFSGLWLIGLWERSHASQKIKQIAGNPDAVASAYSLYDYQIAADLGGEKAYHNLKERAAQRGIRLASDMVPNHMGIDSRWVVEHPDWFIQSRYSPFPAYRFTGPDLSEDDRVGIFIEDGYWNKTDAAVVFKRVDRWTGSATYIYHGNDGTTMPWNDTAQLNYLIPEVREAVIQTILHVARKFPIIRFDAAMTLAKKHYQRLWFPEPGHGGDIPSRAEHAMTKAEFNKVFPTEFWREVVDRVQQEAPDTLLLAEAFWMMESYFVRTLGMHRVYNSAFMNMLKNEENDKYRLSIKNVLEFNPQILKRYVNFMNNPDEETAVNQFGKDDKYFGVCILMATMPGLPMFGHGQVEGFSEKYGMEYKRAYWDETPDDNLIARHEREIFPLLKKRYLFSDVQNFYLYDFYSGDGTVNENVFAYSNRFGNERALVVYNNKFEFAAGWIKESAAFLENGTLARRTLMQGLFLNQENPDICVVFTDVIRNKQFIRSARQMASQGLYLELGAFKYHVFVGFKEVRHTKERPYHELREFLNGQGVEDMETAMDEWLYREPLSLLKKLLSAETSALLLSTKNESLFIDSVSGLNKAFAYSSSFHALSKKETQRFTRSWKKLVKATKKEETFSLPGFSLLLLRVAGASNPPFLSKNIYLNTLRETWQDHNLSDQTIEARLDLLSFTLRYPALFELKTNCTASAYMESLLKVSEAAAFLQINRFESVTYVNKERLELLLEWQAFLISWEAAGKAGERKRFINLLRQIKDVAETSGYRLKALLT